MTTNRLFGLAAYFVLLPLAACGPGDGASSDLPSVVNLPPVASVEAALATLTEAEIVEDVLVLSSDEFGGRAPSSPGEELTMQYLTEQFGALGLEPGGTNGSWTQEVPLVSIMADPNMTLTVAGNGAADTFQYGPDFIAWTTRVVEGISLDASELLFVGYGIVAPEYDWNDYEVTVKGFQITHVINGHKMIEALDEDKEERRRSGLQRVENMLGSLG